ncbi:MAG: DNA-formamidopyrimidine glycosylase [candidate division Zixibacteria bacterium]|nr:DNA-formamidopyrimidine glycosylase [candidate division Zixibacteria bacterium]
MPELPEVETVVRGLRKVILAKTISKVSCFSPKINQDNYSGWLDDIKGTHIKSIGRRGKNILINLSNNNTLWVHLRMTGHFFYLPKKSSIEKHDLVLFDLKNDKNNLRFNDYRRFGRVRLFPTAKVLMQKGLIDLGQEPLKISIPDFIALFKKSSRMTKPALLDQTFIAGLGNIYADESLYATRINPKKQTNHISIKKLIELHSVIQKMLKKSISLMGTTVDSFSGVNGNTGQFQKYLLAYGRDGKKCSRCGSKIKREKIGSRSAHFCPRCQRL